MFKHFDIRTKLIASFIFVAMLVGIVGYLSVFVAGRVTSLRDIELPMEQSLREVEVSIWETVQAANAFRLTGDPRYEELIERQIVDVDEFFTKYTALTDTAEEKRYASEFNALWSKAKEAAHVLSGATKEQRVAEETFFDRVDRADDIIDFNIQTLPLSLAEEQAVREVEVSIWEAIHAAEQYVGLSGAAADETVQITEFNKLMERQFADVAEFWAQYKLLASLDAQTPIDEFDVLWADAVDAGRAIITANDEANKQFDILFAKVDAADDVIDHKMQVFIQKRIVNEDMRADGTKNIMVIVALVGFIVSISFGLVISRSIARPLKELQQVATKIIAGNYTVRAKVGREDEIGQLAEAFNVMTDSLLKAQKLPENILRSMTDALYVVDKEGKITEVNKATQDALGYTREELIGTSISEVFEEMSLEDEEEDESDTKTAEEKQVLKYVLGTSEKEEKGK